MANVLVFVPDLMFSTRIADAARRLGHHVAEVNPGADFAVVLESQQPKLVVLSFEQQGTEWEDLAKAARTAGVRVLAFGRHTNAAAFRRARELGAAHVVPNSQLVNELPLLLENLM
jgi:hypothetical protein